VAEHNHRQWDGEIRQGECPRSVALARVRRRLNGSLRLTRAFALRAYHDGIVAEVWSAHGRTEGPTKAMSERGDRPGLKQYAARRLIESILLAIKCARATGD
jgi:hypothetical protein